MTMIPTTQFQILLLLLLLLLCPCQLRTMWMMSSPPLIQTQDSVDPQYRF